MLFVVWSVWWLSSSFRFQTRRINIASKSSSIVHQLRRWLGLGIVALYLNDASHGSVEYLTFSFLLPLPPYSDEKIVIDPIEEQALHDSHPFLFDPLDSRAFLSMDSQSGPSHRLFLYSLLGDLLLVDEQLTAIWTRVKQEEIHAISAAVASAMAISFIRTEDHLWSLFLLSAKGNSSENAINSSGSSGGGGNGVGFQSFIDSLGIFLNLVSQQ